MKKINENFSGYIEFDNNDYVCDVNNFYVKLLPCIKDKWKPFYHFKEIDKKFFFGIDELGYEIAFYLPGRIGYGLNFLNFFTPVIIKGTANNIRYDLSTFDAITFSGGIINKVYNPKQALELNSFDIENYMQGVNEIKTKPFDQYTKSYELNILNNKVKIMVSIMKDAKDRDITTDDLGKVISFIRFEFENRQGIEKLFTYYNIVHSLLSFLIGQTNIDFEVSLQKRDDKNLYGQIAVCKFFNNFKNFCNRSHNNVISLNLVNDKFSKIIEIFSEEKYYLDFLAEDNNKVNIVDYERIKNICSALEYEFKSNNFQLPKTVIELIEIFKKLIDERIDKEEKLYDYLNSSVSCLDQPLAEKIYAIYERYKAQIDSISNHHPQFKSAGLTKDNISKFVKLRNNITHCCPKINMEDADIFPLLECLVYFSISERIGFTPMEICESIKNLFLGRI